MPSPPTFKTPEKGSVSQACDGLVAAVQGFGTVLFGLNVDDGIQLEERQKLADAANTASGRLADSAEALGDASPEVGDRLQELSDVYSTMAKTYLGTKGPADTIDRRERLSRELETECKATGWRG